MSQVVDLYLVYEFIKRLSTPFNETAAYELGLIDEKGKRIKKASTREEKKAMTHYDRLIFNLKRILGKFGVESKMTSFAAALFLIKEEQKRPSERTNYISEAEFSEFMFNYKDEIKQLAEEAPANNVGGGNIAGAVPGEDPPVSKRALSRYQKNNRKQANTVTRKTFSMVRTT